MNNFRQGEVLSLSSRPGKWLVVSADDYNLSVAQPVVLPFVPKRGYGTAYAVETHEDDPIAGSFLVPFPETLPPNVPAESEGHVTSQTMAKIQESMRLLYGR